MTLELGVVHRLRELVEAAGQDHLVRPAHAMSHGAGRLRRETTREQLGLKLRAALAGHEERHR